MDFNTKYNKFNTKYIRIKKNISHYIKNNIVTIGSGGSDNIVIIDKNVAMKIIPIKTFNNVIDNKDALEYKFYETLYKKYVKPNITPHIVGIYKRYKLLLNKFLPNDCNSNLKTNNGGCCTILDDILLGRKKSNVEYQLCTLKNAYNNKIIDKYAMCLVLEYCPNTISEEIQFILNKSVYSDSDKIKKLEKFLLRVIFQIIYTLAQIQSIDKDFIHNDLFLRNILGVKINQYHDNEYVEYQYDGKSYFLEANGMYVKINDFGYSLNVSNIKTSLIYDIKSSLITTHNYEIKNNKRDIYTFLHDLYAGPNIMGDNIHTLIERYINPVRVPLYLKHIKKLLSNFISLDTIDMIIKKNPDILKNIYNISESKLLMSSIKIPSEYFTTKVFDRLTLPLNGKVIKVYR